MQHLFQECVIKPLLQYRARQNCFMRQFFMKTIPKVFLKRVRLFFDSQAQENAEENSYTHHQAFRHSTENLVLLFCADKKEYAADAQEIVSLTGSYSSCCRLLVTLDSLLCALLSLQGPPLCSTNGILAWLKWRVSNVRSRRRKSLTDIRMFVENCIACSNQVASPILVQNQLNELSRDKKQLRCYAGHMVFLTECVHWRC